MKKTALALLLAFGLVACNNTLTTLETEVQTVSTSICGFEPTLASIADIFTAAYGGKVVEGQVVEIATNVCKVVTATPSTTPSAAQWVYPNTSVVIHGGFVAKKGK